MISLSGSDHRRSQRRPQSGIYSSQRIWLSAGGALTPISGHILESDTTARARKSKPEKKRRRKTHIGGAHNTADLLHRVQVGAQTTVHGENLLINDGGNRQTVEAISKSLPQLNVVAALALVVESIDTVDRSALVVATQNEEVLGILDLVGEQEADGLERLLATVDIITEEQVVGLRGETAVFEEAQKVVVLAVDITANLNKSPTRQKHGLPVGMECWERSYKP